MYLSKLKNQNAFTSQIRLQFKATLQGGARKGKVSQRSKKIDV